MRRDQRQKLDAAAAIESGRRPSTIEAGPLLLELAMPGVEQILATENERRIPAPRRVQPDRRAAEPAVKVG